MIRWNAKRIAEWNAKCSVSQKDIRDKIEQEAQMWCLAPEIINAQWIKAGKIKYLAQFFEIINDPKTLEKKVLRYCR